MKLQRFDGGLNIREEAHLIGINEGQVYSNIDNEAGSLQPVNTPLAAGLSKTQNDKYIKYLDAITTLAKTPTSLIEYQDKTYYTVENDFVQIFDSNGEGDLGFDRPELQSVELITTIPATPVGGDLTNLFSTQVGGFTPWTGFAESITYNFAFIQTDAESNQSKPLYYNRIFSGAPGTYWTFGFQLPYTYQVCLKVAGIWRVLKTGVEPFPGFGVVGTANANMEVDRNTFSVTAYSEPIDLDVLDAIDLFPAGNYTYVTTCYSSVLGWESEPSDEANAITTGTEQVRLIYNLDPADARVDRFRIYRLGNAITDFTLVDEIVDPVFPVTFTDRTPDADIVGNHIMDSEDYDKPLSGLTNLTVVNGQLTGTIGSILYFSLIGKLFAFPSTNTRDFEEDITGTFQIDAGLLVFSADRTWLLNTSNLAAGKVINISKEFGCLAHLTVAGYKTGAIWASTYGLCSSFGGKVELVSKNKLGYITLDIINAKMHNETYWGFSNAGQCIAFDLRYGQALKRFKFGVFEDSNANTTIRQIYRDDAELKVLFGTVSAVDSYTLFAGATKETLEWTSPRFVEGSYTVRKTYKDIFIRATADMTIKVYIEDQEDNLVAEEKFHETETHHIKVDQERLQGYALYFTAEGTGKVLEIEYKAMGVQSGR